jgi:hypothetical protein
MKGTEMVGLICGVSEKPCKKCNGEGEIIIEGETFCKSCLCEIVSRADAIRRDAIYARQQLRGIPHRDVHRALDALERIIDG